MLISTNIIRDEDLEFDYIVTENTQRIFNELIEGKQAGGKCFNLIGSYGTGKSSFLVAFEQTVLGKRVFFKSKKAPKNPGFIKLIGKPQSIREALALALDLNPRSSVEDVQEALGQFTEKHDRVFVLADELGKFIEYALNNNPKVETYVFQRIAEFINHPESKLMWVGTLHQNFDSYATSASAADSMEWEKVGGRFLTLNFNEPATTLLKLVSARLRDVENKGNSKAIASANNVIESAQLIPDRFIQLASEDAELIRPFDGLSAFLTISLLQKYGQNERSIFSFLSARGAGTVKNFNHAFFNPGDLVDYCVDRLAHVIFSNANPDKLLWEAAERSIQRSDSHAEINPSHARVAIRTILLTNIFGREGSSFDIKALTKYLKAICGKEAKETIDALLDKNIIQFLKHRGKVVFVEGTDVNIQNELRIASKYVSSEIDLLAEVVNRVTLAPALSKGHFIRKGTPRFFHFVLHGTQLTEKFSPTLGNGLCHVVLGDNLELNLDQERHPQLMVDIRETSELKVLMRDVLLYEEILKKYSDDLVVKQLVTQERNHVLNQLNSALQSELTSAKSIWVKPDGSQVKIASDRQLNALFQSTFNEAFSECPVIQNELVNQAKLSTSANTSRKALVAALCQRATAPNLNFPEDRFPAEKSIFQSTWASEGLYDFTTGTLKEPTKGSTFRIAWDACEQFLKEAEQGKISLVNLFNQLQEKPFGMKKGLLSYWIPMFMLTKEDEFALYYTPEDKYLPYLSVDIFESIIKKPQDFVVKKFNFTGVSLATLNQYRELAKIDHSRTEARGTYLGIFTNFIVLQRNLNAYGLNTKTISTDALALRKAIAEAPDPETALFETIPSAIGFHQIASTEDDQVVLDYFEKLRATAREIAGSYSELLNRLEQSIADAVRCNTGDFASLKESVLNALTGVDTVLLPPKLRTTYERMVSPLDDRESWIKSVADVALGKSLDQLQDEEEPKLHKALQESIEALIAHKGLMAAGIDQLAVSVTMPTGEHVKRYIPQLTEDAEVTSRLAKRLEGLSADERLQLISLILETENTAVTWE